MTIMLKISEKRINKIPRFKAANNVLIGNSFVSPEAYLTCQKANLAGQMSEKGNHSPVKWAFLQDICPITGAYLQP